MTELLERTSEQNSALSWTPHRWATPRTPERPTYGPAVAAVSAAMGRPLMPHQLVPLMVGLEVQSEDAGDPDPGQWAYDEVAETIERRGGKTSKIAPVAAHRARLIERCRIFLTAQNRDKARKRWFDVTDDMLKSPLRSDVKRTVGRMAEELRWLENGSVMEPFAPNEDGLHSETPHLVFVDELWAFLEEQRAAIQAGYVPAFATTGGQAWLMSTQGTPKSSWLNDVTRLGRRAVERGDRLGLAYFEHSLPDRVGGVLLRDLPDADLVDACIANHPAVCHTPGCRGPVMRAAVMRPCPHGFTVQGSVIRSAWSKMNNRDEFVRAYGNRSTGEAAETWLGMAESVYLRQLDADGIPTNARIGLGVAVDKDSRDAAVSVAWRDPRGRMHVEQIRETGGQTVPEVGTRWVAGLVAGFVERNKPAAVAVANVGASRDIADQLERAGVEVLKVSQADVSAACVRHRDELDAGSWFHRVNPVLTSAASHVEWSGREWVPGPGGPVSAFTSGTMAGWAFDHAPAPAGRFWMG